MRRVRLFLACGLALLAILSVSTPASGITYGTPDTTHTFVGAWIHIGSDGTILGRPCDGILVSARVFLVAGQCAAGWMLGVPLSETFVTFALDERDSSAWRSVAAVVVDPLYDWTFYNNPHDLAVVILAKPVKGITPGNLVPSAGYLDQLAASGALVPLTTTFQVVGYGEDQNFQPTYMREVATEGFLSLQPAWLSDSSNPDLGYGGTCYFDSGAPMLYTAGTTQYIVAFGAIGDVMCRALDKGYRADTTEALSFIQAEIAAYK